MRQQKATMNLGTRLAILGDVAREAVKNFAMMLPLVRAWRVRYPRSADYASEITGADLHRYAFSALEMILTYVPRSRIQGATVVEVGPGDNVVLGMPLLALGAYSYHAIDPFLGNVDSEYARRLYARVAEELPTKYGIAMELIPPAHTYPGARAGNRVFLYRIGVEDYQSLHLQGKADVVFSHGVGQSVVRPESFAQATYAFLKPGGIAIHRIFFGPVGCWCAYSNPLTFLSVPGAFWGAMGTHRGTANRLRFSQFLRSFVASGLGVKTHVLNRFSPDDLGEIRQHLARPFDTEPNDSLAVREADFVCVKSG